MTEPRSRATVLPASADVGIVDASWRVALPQPPLNNNFSLQYDAGKKQWVEPSFEVYKIMELVQRQWQVLVHISTRNDDDDSPKKAQLTKFYGAASPCQRPHPGARRQGFHGLFSPP